MKRHNISSMYPAGSTMAFTMFNRLSTRLNNAVLLMAKKLSFVDMCGVERLESVRLCDLNVTGLRPPLTTRQIYDVCCWSIAQIR